MPDPRPPSPLTLWLEEALTGWILPILALALVGGALGLYLLGALPDGPSAAVLAVVVAVGAGLLTVRPTLAGTVEPYLRGAAAAVAVMVAALTALPSIGAVWPGEPVAQGDLAKSGEALALPAGLEGRVRVLVHAPLPPGGTPQVDVRLGLGAGAEAVSGRVERTLSAGRAGRSRTTVTHDRNETWLHGRMAPGATAVTLERLTGQIDGPLHVAVYRDVLPPAWRWVVAVAILLAVALVEARLVRGNPAAFAGIGLAYGLLVGGWGTPATAVGTSLGALLLGALGGGTAGTVAAWLVKLGPWRPTPAERARGRTTAG